MKIVGGLAQEGGEWLRWREGGIGGSDVAAVVGLNPYQSRNSLLKKKSKRVDSGVRDNVHTARGKRYEPLVRQLHEELFGWPMPAACVQHDSVEWARASLDGIRDDHQLLLEVKCPTAKRVDEVRQNGPFAYYVAQCQYQLWITGAPLCHLVVFDAEEYQEGDPAADRWLLFELEPDLPFQQAMVGELEEFWAEVCRLRES